MRLLLAVAALLLAPAFASAGHELPAPADAVPVTIGSTTHQVWPWTYQAPADPADPILEKRRSDPVNLIFVDADPREIRQALLSLPKAPPFNCRWIDAMGYDQAGWADDEGWVGSGVQLACTDSDENPMGDKVRFHLRLFREGGLTLGAAHFELRVPNTAEHEVLSWNTAQAAVEVEMMRSGTLTGGTSWTAPLVAPGAFRTVNWQVYKGLPTALRALAGLPLDASAPPVQMPLNGTARVLHPRVRFEPGQERTSTPFAFEYTLPVAPKPICNGGSDYVSLAGTLRFRLDVHTNPSGMFSRTYRLFGTLTVTPVNPLTGAAIGAGHTAVVSERHTALVTDNYQEVTEEAGKTLMSSPQQWQVWTLKLGQQDETQVETVCPPLP